MKLINLLTSSVSIIALASCGNLTKLAEKEQAPVANSPTTNNPNDNTRNQIQLGDANKDGQVNNTDFSFLYQQISSKKELSCTTNKEFDINQDGKIDLIDVISLLQLILKQQQLSGVSTDAYIPSPIVDNSIGCGCNISTSTSSCSISDSDSIFTNELPVACEFKPIEKTTCHGT